MPHVEVTLCEILQYIGDRSRSLKEGEALFKAGHVILCGLQENTNSNCIKSLCSPTSCLTAQPHEVTIVLNKKVKMWKCVCTCKDGLDSFCKHIVATLICVNRNENLELVSCTDLAQKLGNEKKGIEETHKAQPFKEFCHPITKRKKIVFKTSSQLDKDNFALLSTGVADSALSKFL